MRKFMSVLLCIIMAAIQIPVSGAEYADGAILTRTISYETSEYPVSVYRDAELTEYWGELPAYAICQVSRSSNGVAWITYKGRTGYISSSDMSPIPSGSYVVTIRNAYVYQSPSKRARKVRLKKDTVVIFIANQDACAMVQNPANGVYGYMDIENLAVMQTSWTT